jgi:hypothetical protein
MDSANWATLLVEEWTSERRFPNKEELEIISTSFLEMSDQEKIDFLHFWMMYGVTLALLIKGEI